MGYSNTFSLKVEGNRIKQIKKADCPCQTTSEDLSQNFCLKCGKHMSQRIINQTEHYDIIEELIKTYQDGDCGYLLEEDGSCSESGSGYNINKEIKEFSKKYPTLTFILSTQWESGLVEEGQPSTDYFFFNDGVEKQAECKIIYINPFTGVEF